MRSAVDPFYAVVRVIARFWIWFFFERVEVRHPERVPCMGPVLLCINHPNNLIDSLLIGSVLSRKVHYLATAALFRNPLMSRFLVALGVIPVYLKADDPDKLDRNTEMFAACDEAFEGERLIAIYPEGTTRADVHVQRIKTGAARIALSFEARERFRGRVLVSFGEPVAVSSYLAVYREEPAKALHALEGTADRQRVARSWQTIVGLPLFAYGADANFLPYYLPRWLATRMSRRQTDYATTRLLASVAAFPLLWALETSLVGWAAGLRWALVFFLSLPLGGLIAYRYLVGTGRLRHQLRFGALFVTRAQEARRLLAERREIVGQLERARRDYESGVAFPRRIPIC